MRMRAAGFSNSAGVEIRPHGDAHDQPEQRRDDDRKTQRSRPAPIPTAAFATSGSRSTRRRGCVRARIANGLRISRRTVRVRFGRTRFERIHRFGPEKSFRCHGASMVVMNGLSVTAGGRLARTIRDLGLLHNGTSCGQFIGRRQGTKPSSATPTTSNTKGKEGHDGPYPSFAS